MMAKGLDPGPALVFLLAGPATNLATLSVIRGTLGAKVLAVYLSAIVVGALLLGHVVEWVYPLLDLTPTVAFTGHDHVHDSTLRTVAGVLVVAALAWDMARRVRKRLGGTTAPAT